MSEITSISGFVDELGSMLKKKMLEGYVPIAHILQSTGMLRWARHIVFLEKSQPMQVTDVKVLDNFGEVIVQYINNLLNQGYSILNSSFASLDTSYVSVIMVRI